MKRPPGDSLAELLAWEGPLEVERFLQQYEQDGDRNGRLILQAMLESWEFWGRRSQQFPPGDWSVWLIKTGRGWGKNQTGSEWVHHKAYTMPGSHGFLAARTSADVRDTVVQGVSGILASQKSWLPCEYVSSKRMVRWANGTTAHLYSSEEPDQARGPNHHWGLADEWATWKATRGKNGGTCWQNLGLGCRLPYQGKPPQIVVTTTPRPTKEMRELLKRPGIVVTSGHQKENAAHLSREYLEEMEREYGDTRMGRQERAGELIDNVEGAILTADMIDEMRLDAAPRTIDRVVIGVDPSGGADEQGVIGAGRVDHCKCGMGGPLPHFVVLADASGRYSPEGWGTAAVNLYHSLSADRILGERNYGGDLVESNVRNIDSGVSYRDVVASRGKSVRAEPCLALYERKRVHHVGAFAQLEDELCRFVPGRYAGEGSPNRADAAVWCLTHLSPRWRRAIPRIRLLG